MKNDNINPINTLTSEEFSDLFPRCKEPEQFLDALKNAIKDSDINTDQRVAAFIAQCAHESGGFSAFEENLRYSAKALNKVFSKYFKRAGRDAQKYAYKPEKIANVVYANRMGNGPQESGDGWRYRGRGPIQLTGKNNYSAFSSDENIDVVNNPDSVSDYYIGLRAAMWFWDNNDLNTYADRNDIKGMTRRINGGYHGLSNRYNHYVDLLNVFRGRSRNAEDGKYTPSKNANTNTVIEIGDHGESVKTIQRMLGINDDGIFGKGTRKAVISFQRANGLTQDGVVGPKTLRILVSHSIK